MTNTTLATLSTLQLQITAIADGLRPGNDEAVAKSLQSLMKAGLMLSTNIKAEDMNKVYSYAVNGLAKDAITNVTRKLVRGEFDLKNKDFIPLPAEFASLIRSEQRMISEDLTRARSRLEAIEGYKPPPPANEETKAKVREMLAAFKSEQRAVKEAQRGYVEIPLDAEGRDRLAKMLTLPDAKNITAENLAFRRLAEKKISEG